TAAPPDSRFPSVRGVLRTEFSPLSTRRGEAEAEITSEVPAQDARKNKKKSHAFPELSPHVRFARRQ
ncbi:hypothetical protein chiPu_0021895, partial [Chiloscyllium punctatum]|nr:hypothetical protein [Chiloscyllium punctatum]